MKYGETYIDFFENLTSAPIVPFGYIRILSHSRIIKTRILGPLSLNRNSQLGPDLVIGKYCGFNDNCFASRGSIGAFCAIGARCSINPFNHPIDWLSVHEFQYLRNGYDWVPEYSDFSRLPRTADMFGVVNIGNDVWLGHNVNVLSGVTLGDGAVIGAGSVVTKDIPPYAIAVGVPAIVKRYRFPDAIIQRLLRARWWDLELSQLSGLPFRDIERCLDAIEEIRAGQRIEMVEKPD